MSETTGRPREDRELKALLYRNGPRNYARRLMIEACMRRESCNEATLARALELPGHWPHPEFPISGRDLLELGVPPGPAIGDWLSKLETEWVEADFSLSGDELRHRAARLLSRRKN
jgi:poly(A) polymerase